MNHRTSQPAETVIGHQTAESVSPAQRAYALLWRDMNPKSQFVREARAVLLASLSKDQQRDAIGWVQQNYPITERDILELAANAEPG